jgi:hypothetical protein
VHRSFQRFWHVASDPAAPADIDAGGSGGGDGGGGSNGGGDMAEDRPGLGLGLNIAFNIVQVGGAGVLIPSETVCVRISSFMPFRFHYSGPPHVKILQCSPRFFAFDELFKFLLSAFLKGIIK